MIDLHLHLDGSLSLKDFKFLADRYEVKLGREFPDNVRAPKECKSLEEYLTRFDLPCSLLQDEFAIAYAVSSLIDKLYGLGYIYAEIRFAPQLHTQNGMSQYDAVLAAVTGLKSALKDKPDFDANLILCCMRQADQEINMETIRIAEKFAKEKVVAVDLAGPEAYLTGDHYVELFDEAKKRNLNVIIHAGEACGSDEVMRCIDLLHAQRIGHGVHLQITPENLQKIVENRITFEFCPTSNLQTKSLPNYQSVPLKEFDRFGIPVTINSDNMTVSNTNVIKEFQHLYRTFKLQKHEVRHFLMNSIYASFAPLETKMMLIRELDKKLDRFYQRVTESNKK